MAWAFLWFSSFKSRWEGFTILFKTHGISIIKFFSTLIIKLFHCKSITLILFCCQKRHKYFKSRHVHHHLNLKWVNSKMLSPLSADFTKWSNTHKQFVNMNITNYEYYELCSLLECCTLCDSSEFFLWASWPYIFDEISDFHIWSNSVIHYKYSCTMR